MSEGTALEVPGLGGVSPQAAHTVPAPVWLLSLLMEKPSAAWGRATRHSQVVLSLCCGDGWQAHTSSPGFLLYYFVGSAGDWSTDSDMLDNSFTMRWLPKFPLLKKKVHDPHGTEALGTRRSTGRT